MTVMNKALFLLAIPKSLWQATDTSVVYKGKLRSFYQLLNITDFLKKREKC